MATDYNEIQKLLAWYKDLMEKTAKALAAVPPSIKVTVNPPSPFATGGPIIAPYAPPPPIGGNHMSGPVKSTGMAGFSEDGQPDQWDMAVGEIFGYRWWKLEVPAELAGYATARMPFTGYTRLVGANSCHWDRGRLEAVCTKSPSSTPTWDDLVDGIAPVVHEPPEYRVACGCGFWAYFDKDLDVTRIFGAMNGPQPELSYGGGSVNLPILGVVKGTGRVIIGTKGFRSQYAEIVGLCVPDTAKEQLSWDLTQRGYFRSDRYGHHSVYDSFRYATYGADIYGNQYGSSPVIRPADESRRLERYAYVEAILSTQYPDVKVFSDQANMVKYFPPDKNYA